jgi:hypothetical protein
METAPDERTDIEDNPDFSVYWTAIPQAMRWVTGDPFGGPWEPLEFQNKAEDSAMVGWQDSTSEIEWDAESDFADIVGMVKVGDCDNAEGMASSLAIDLDAQIILKQKELPLYIVCGSFFLPSNDGCFAPWALFVSDVGDSDDRDDHHSDPDDSTDYTVSVDAARWAPRTPRAKATSGTMTDELQEANCLHCPKTIIRAKDGDAWTPWVHLEHSLSRGCRSASFDRESGWDELLDRRWLAAAGRDNARPFDSERNGEALAELAGKMAEWRRKHDLGDGDRPPEQLAADMIRASAHYRRRGAA